MPEISDAQYGEFVAYQQIGTPKEVAKKIRDLEEDNRKYRQEEKPALEAKVPKEGEVVIPKADAEALEQYRSLGAPDELKTVKEQRDQLQVKDAARVREDAFRGATKAMGWPEDTVATLLDMRSLDGAALEIKREKNEKGEDVEVPYVTLAGDGQQPQKFRDFAAAAPQLKGLKVEAARDPAPAPAYPRQQAEGKPPRTERTPDDVRKSVEGTANYTL